MIIPHQTLSPEALQGIIEAFVTREGTDYGVVTVQVVKTSITPQLATSERVRAAKTEPLHPAGRLHMRR